MEQRRDGPGTMCNAVGFFALGRIVVTLKVPTPAAHPLKRPSPCVCRHDSTDDIVPRFQHGVIRLRLSGRRSRNLLPLVVPTNDCTPSQNSISARTRAQARWLAQRAFGCCEWPPIWQKHPATCTTVFKVVDTTPPTIVSGPALASLRLTPMGRHPFP